ncbi:MAG TPA: alpha/beta fold hydrolase [Rhizomicrobium sp.]|jgi:non-heme chloroperoxidase|nr:alpha/beta fold hydrolase [Rhizomicrobium sp.]
MKPPVFLIHGAFCGPWSLEGLQQKFEKAGYSCTAPALRFHDEARPPAALGTTGLADYAADLEEEIQVLGAAPILVGHSMGGLLAQQLASRTNVAALILLAPSPPWGVPPTTLFEISAAQAMHLQPGYWNMVLEPSRDVALAHSLEKLPRHMRDDVFGRLVPESGRATFEIMSWGLDLSHASEVDADAVTAPLLFLTGSEDRINPPSTVARIAALYKERAASEVLDGMGHWLIGEPGWERLAERALEWLKAQKL